MYQSDEKFEGFRAYSLSKDPPHRILLDSSFLLTMLSEHRELEDEITDLIQRRVLIQTLDRVVQELERLSRMRSSKLGAIAKASLELIEKRNFQIIENNLGSPDVDTCLIARALIDRNPTLVASVDRELRETLSSQGISTIYPKSKRGLTILGARPARLK